MVDTIAYVRSGEHSPHLKGAPEHGGGERCEDGEEI
jgi:hypothetical protein